MSHILRKLHNSLNNWRTIIGKEALKTLRDSFVAMDMNGESDEAAIERASYVEGMLENDRFLYANPDDEVSIFH